jgi:MFS-type transporter involved in bile tolerance (Atg22 family)
VPAPRMYLFFSLFFIVGKTSSFVGPFIASAIINDADGNTSASFWWTFFSGVAGLVLLSLVDVKKAKIACAECE